MVAWSPKAKLIENTRAAFGTLGMRREPLTFLRITCLYLCRVCSTWPVIKFLYLIRPWFLHWCIWFVYIQANVSERILRFACAFLYSQGTNSISLLGERKLHNLNIKMTSAQNVAISLPLNGYFVNWLSSRYTRSNSISAYMLLATNWGLFCYRARGIPWVQLNKHMSSTKYAVDVASANNGTGTAP